MVTAPLSLPTSALTASTLSVVEMPDFALTGQSPAALTKEEIDLATHTIDPSKARHALYDLYHDYHEGRQRDPRGLRYGADDRTKERTFTSPHNVCGPLVDILVERLTVGSVRVTAPDGTKTAQTDDLAALLWRWWQAARMDAIARITHRHNFKYGDAFVMVEWDPFTKRPIYSLEDARRITPVYDGDHNPLAFYKAWQETSLSGSGLLKQIRINKYRAGLVEKFVSVNGAQYVYWTGDRDRQGVPDGGIIPMLDRNGAPLPIPIVHFRNMADTDDFGRSELADAIPMADEFNKRTWATGQAAIFDGARIKYGVNIAAFIDPDTGAQRDPPLGPNAFWYLKPDDPQITTEVGTLEPGDVTQLQEAADRELKTIAGLLGIPLHMIWPSGGLPSGESLKTAEARLVSKLLDRSVTLGNAWEDVHYLAIRLANAYGGLGLPEDVLCTTMWLPMETRSALADEQVIALKADDLSWRQRMRERDYPEEEIAAIETERDDEKAAEPVPVVVEAAPITEDAAPMPMMDTETEPDAA